MTIITRLSLISAVALSIATPAIAQQPAWSQRGDYYSQDKTAGPQVAPGNRQELKEGDYYASDKTIVRQPTAAELRQERHGDYYAPAKGN